MKGLSGFFAKYAQLGVSEKATKNATREVIKELLDIDIPPAQISIKNKEIQLNVQSSLKFVIIEKKTDILKRLKEILGDSSPKSIK